MPSSNRTSDFREVLREKQNALPDSKRQKILSHSQRDSRPDEQNVLGQKYVAEAYVILNHINTLAQMLANIRKSYLNVDSRNPSALTRQSSRNIEFGRSVQTWTELQHLNNEERDQIDLQARVILTRCADRVKEMEAIEKRRAELVASNSNAFTRFLPSRLRPDASSASSNFVAVHHSSITWYLSRRLTEVSQTQKDMQEERVKRQLERTRTLGSGAAREALNMEVDRFSSVTGQPESTAGSSGLEVASSSLIATSIGDPDDEIELSASQILQFESENASILRTVQDTLESVRQAESRLLDISALQMDLVSHLTKQTELTDQLYEDAIATSSAVGKGNIQLREARKRAKDSRLFILLFLVGASLSLLFLHYY